MLSSPYRNTYRANKSMVSDDIVERSSLSLSTCRICLKGGKIPIFGQNNRSEDVMEFGDIEISYGDNHPQHLCRNCLALLEAAILFRKTAKTSDEILKNGDYKDDTSVLSEDQDYGQDILNDTDNESFIKREYLEYNSESDTEISLKCNTELENVSNISDSDAQRATDKISNIVHSPKGQNEVTVFEDSSNNSENDKLFTTNEYLDYLLGSDHGLDQNLQAECVESENFIDTQETDINNVETQPLEEDEDNDTELVMLIVSEQQNNTFNCKKCNISFNDNQELQNHDAENHTTTSCYKKCDICNKSIRINDYNVHLMQHREKYKEKHEKKYGKVECEVCNKIVNKSYYKYHMKMHGTAEEQAERLVDCTICKKTFSAHYYSAHMKRMHDKTETNIKKSEQNESISKMLKKCPVCDKYVYDDTYKEHLAKHGGSTRQYICDKCGKVFKQPSTFRTHSLTHGSELKYQCQFCPYRGLHLGLLKIHVRTHTGDYNYKCTECPARFVTKSNLTKHFQRHRGQCNFKCETCNRGFYSKRDVDKHIKTVHLALKNYLCNICGKGFGHRDNMLSHQLKVHKRERITDKRGRMPSYLKGELMNL